MFLSKNRRNGDGENPVKTYYKDWITNNSTNIFVGYNPSQVKTQTGVLLQPPIWFQTDNTPVTTGDGLWGQDSTGSYIQWYW